MEIHSTLTRITYLKHMLVLLFRTGTPYIYIGFVIIFFIWGLILHSRYLTLFPVTFLFIGVIYYGVWFLYQLYWAKSAKYYYIERRIDFRDEGILIEIASWELFHKWEAFKKWAKVGGCYRLIFLDDNAIMIPIPDIPSSKIRDFEMLLNEKVNKTVIRRLAIKNE